MIDYKKHNRRSIRLKNYDYSQKGIYFVTICTQNHACLFGKILDGIMKLNEYGIIIRNEWVKLATTRDEIELDEFVVMPNHFHGIVAFTEPVGAIHESPSVRAIHELPSVRAIHELPLHMTQIQRRNMGLPKIIGRFKMLSSKQINILRKTPGTKIWQRNYWEHVVRDEIELNRIRKYTKENPIKWETDRLYP